MVKGKRILSFLLVFALVLSMLPMAALASYVPSITGPSSGDKTLWTARKRATDDEGGLLLPAIYQSFWNTADDKTDVRLATVSTGFVADSREIVEAQSGDQAYCVQHIGASAGVPGHDGYEITVSPSTKNNIYSDSATANAWLNAVLQYGYPNQSAQDIINQTIDTSDLSFEGRTTLKATQNAESHLYLVPNKWVEMATQLAVWYVIGEIYIAGLTAPRSEWQKDHTTDWEQTWLTQVPIVYFNNPDHDKYAKAVLTMTDYILNKAYQNKDNPIPTAKMSVTLDSINDALLLDGLTGVDLTKNGRGVKTGTTDTGTNYTITNGTPHTQYEKGEANRSIYRQWLNLQSGLLVHGSNDYWESEVYYSMYFALTSDTEPTKTKIHVDNLSTSAMAAFTGGSGQSATIVFLDPKPEEHLDRYEKVGDQATFVANMKDELLDPTSVPSWGQYDSAGKFIHEKANHVPQELIIWDETTDSDDDAERGRPLEVNWIEVTKENASSVISPRILDTSSWNDGESKWVAVGKVITPAWSQNDEFYKQDFDKSEIANGGGGNKYNWETGRPQTDFTITAEVTTPEKALYRGNNNDFQDVAFWAAQPTTVDTNVKFHWDGIRFQYEEEPVPNTDVRVHKVDANTNADLAGAVFRLSVESACANRTSLTETTNSEGLIEFPKLPPKCSQLTGYDPETGDPIYKMKPCPHRWTIEEISAPTTPRRYYASNEPTNGFPTTFTISQIPADGVTFEWPNVPVPDPQKLTIRKVDADTGRVIPGAWFKVENIDTGTAYTYLAANGVISLHNDPSKVNDPYYVPSGSYVVSEYIEPAGYEKTTEVQTFNFNEYGSGSGNELVFVNHKKPQIQLTKIDANSRIPISGVTFDYWYNGQYKGQTKATNDVGVTILTDLKTGTYTFKERSVPNKYIKSDREFSLYVDCSESSAHKISSLIIENYAKKSIVLTKEDAETGWKLEGARFDIRGVDNSFVGTAETDATGTAVVEGLGYGTYSITETRAPAGYEITAEPYTLVINETTTADTIVVPAFQDDPEPGLLIRKIDSTTSQAIPNVSFKVEYLGEGGTQTTNYTTDANGLIIIPDAKIGWYRITETSTPAGYVQNTEPQMVQVTATNEPTTVTFENHQTGLLNVLKLESGTGLPLAGARFEVRTAGGDLIDTLTTGGNGYATLSGLVPGSYVVQEVEAPDRHVIDPYPQTFEVKAGDAGKTYLLVFHNTDMASIYIRKVDADTNQGLAGAVFKVVTADGTVVAERVVTGDDGLALVDRLTTDTYIITEIRSPEGYLLDAPPQTVKIYSGQTKTVTFRDNKPGGIAIKKVDAATNLSLPGAVFELHDLDGHKIGTTYTTGEDGIVRITDLEPGHYMIKEIQAPDGYQCDGNDIRVKVEPFIMTDVTVTNTQKSSLTIEKRDKETNVLLEGAVFKVTTQDGTLVAEGLTTGKGGTVTVNGLAEGIYYVTETKAPDGYLLDTTAHMVITTGDEATIFTAYNQVMKNLVIRKVDANTATPLAGATFDLYELDGALVGTYTTDTSGTITTQALKPGFYTLKETHAPDGYEAGWIPSATTGSATAGGAKVTQQTIQVPEGEAVTITIPNTPLPVIEIQKADAITGKPLVGAQFEVRNEAGNVIGVYTTGAAGNVFTECLPSGWYKVTEVKAPTGYGLNTESMSVKLTAGVPTVARFTNKPLTSLLITKIDDATEKPLMGAAFELRTLDGTTIGRYTTGENGTANTAAMIPGKYQLVEVAAPDGYMLDSKVYPVTILAGASNSITLRNKAFPTLTVFKGDSTGKPLPGATIKLETADGDFVAQGVTDSAGELIFTNIKPGHYIVTETKAPTGYEKVSDPVVTTVEYGKLNRVELVNAQWGGLLIKLVDQKDGKPLANGQFTVTHCIDNSIVFTGTTDTAGTILVGNLVPGDKYIATQTFAPDGYTIVDKEKNEFVVAGENRLILFEDAIAGIVIEKVDAITGKTLAGARFQLTRNSDNIVIGEYVTGTDGLALASGLIPGMYTVEELEAPEDYTIDEGPKLVHVKANTTAHVTFKDTPFAGITIKSIDSVTNKPIAGTVFEVYEQNGELVGSYTTDSTGTVETGVLAPGHYVIKQTYVKDGYEAVETQRTVEIKDGVHVTETFYSVPAGTLNIYALDNSYKGLAGMRATVTKINGELVTHVLTDSTGTATITGLTPGYYVVTETKAPDGYLIGTAVKNVLVMAGKPANVYFTHDKTYGVQILTTVKQTNLPLANVQYQVTKPNGEIIKTYASDEAGYIYVPLDPGDYVITPVAVPSGYTIADSQKITVVKANRYSTVNFVATQLSSIRVQLVDGQTGKGIYGVRLLVKNSAGDIVSECWTNNEGKIVLTKELPDGTYTLEQITVPDGYAMDKIPKTVQILNGQTTEVTWTLWKVAGQIQVELRSADDNSILAVPRNSLLMGGIFEVVDPVSYQVVATITTDAYGVAATKGLPLGRYLVRQLSAPAYYANSTQVSEVTLKVANDVVRVNFYDPSLALTVAVDHKSNNNVSAGQTMRVDVLEVSNNSNTALANAYWTIKVPTDCARISTFYTGSWNQAVWYTVSYKTNMTDFRELAKNLNSTTNNQFDLSSTALGLQSGEYVTDVRFEFGNVPANWKLTTKPAFMLYILPGVYNGYKVITRMEYGGKYLDAWVSNTSLWTTNVFNPANKGTVILPGDDKFPTSLPKTGY